MAKLRPSRNEETYTKNTKEQYEELGRFIEMFELMVNEARDACIDLLTKDMVHRDFVMIPFHHQSLTAKPLFEIWRAIITETIKAPTHPRRQGQEAFADLLGKLQNIYENIANMRNNLLHGTWFIGVSTEDDPDAATFRLRKYTSNAEGFAELSLPKLASDLRRLRNDCDIIRTWIAVVTFCLLDETTELADYFEKQDGTWFLINLYGTPQPLPDKWRPTPA